MKTLWESILDTDADIQQDIHRLELYMYFAECFVKIFGKLNRLKGHYRLIYQCNGELNVGSFDKRSTSWKWDSWKINEFTYKLGQMNKLIKKRYPKIVYAIESHNMQRYPNNVWLCRYLISWYIDEEQEHGINWTIDVTKMDDIITRIAFHSLSQYALKDKELLKIIDDNI